MAGVPWWSRSVKDLTDAYLDGRTSPIEVLDTLLDAASRSQPSLNAFVQLGLPGSHAAAEAATLRFAKGNPLGPLADYIHYGTLVRSMDDCRRLQAIVAQSYRQDLSL